MKTCSVDPRPVLIGESERTSIPGLNLLSMSDSFKTIQTHSKQRHFIASQV